MLSGKNLPHELLLTTSQTTKLRNAVEKNKSTDIKFSKTQISKIISSGGYLGLLLSKLAGPLMKVNSSSFGKQYFSSIRNNSCCFSN